MTTKLTITIPDDLADLLRPWRDRMNISDVCAKAIAQEVAHLDKAMPGRGEPYRAGYRRGAEWAEAHPEELQELDISFRHRWPTPYYQIQERWPELKGNPYTVELTDVIENPEPGSGWSSMGFISEPPEAEAFARGWLEALRTAKRKSSGARS